MLISTQERRETKLSFGRKQCIVLDVSTEENSLRKEEEKKGEEKKYFGPKFLCCTFSEANKPYSRVEFVNIGSGRAKSQKDTFAPEWRQPFSNL